MVVNRSLDVKPFEINFFVKKLITLDFESLNSYWVNFYDLKTEPFQTMNYKYQFVFSCFIQNTIDLMENQPSKMPYYYDFTSVESFFQDDSFKGKFMATIE